MELIHSIIILSIYIYIYTASIHYNYSKKLIIKKKGESPKTRYIFLENNISLSNFIHNTLKSI